MGAGGGEIHMAVDPAGVDDIEYTDEHEVAPEDPIVPPGRWMKENLFSSASNTAQTVVFSAILLLIIRWLLSQVFADDSDWSSVATNLRLLFAYNYPVEQFVRIWFCVGALMVAVGLSIAAWNLDLSVTVRKLAINAASTGALLVLFAILAPGTTPDSIHVGMLVVGLVLVAIGVGTIVVVKNPHRKRIPFEALLIGFAVFVIAVVNLFPFGRYEFANNEASAASGTVNISTKGPWTVMMLILVATYFLGKALATLVGRKPLTLAMVIWWVVGPAFLIFLVLRDPAFDWGYVWRVDIPIAAAFAILGGGLLYFLAKPGIGELGRAIGAFLLFVAVFTFVAAFFGWGYESFGGIMNMLQKVRISFFMLAFFALLAPTFAGEHAARLRFAFVWVGLIVISHWLITGINTPSTLDIVAPPFLGGFVLTLSVAYYVMLASFPLGILLALARTSKMPIFRVMSTVYIEFVRGIPLITVLFFFAIMLNLFLPRGMTISNLAAIFVGYTVFSAAYMAENIRGGLQSIRRGQYEASDALGLTTVQRTGFIVLPQALRVSIPNLVGQAIATFKETSLIAIVGGFDILRIANSTISNQAEFIGQKRPALLFVSVVYWVFAYSMSRASRNLEKRLGVGQGR